MSMYHYRIYGLHLEANQPIRELAAVAADQPDVMICFGDVPPGLQPDSVRWVAQSEYLSRRAWDQGDYPTLRIYASDDDTCLRFHYLLDDIHFILTRSGDQVWIAWSGEQTTRTYTIPYLLGPIIGFVLRLRGVFCLHASVIQVDQRCFAITGQVGAGKSTLAAAFVQQGHHILSDDVAPLRIRDGQYRVQPGYPRLRLWRNSIEALQENPDTMPRIIPDMDKHYYDLRQRFYPDPLPLHAIYTLHERRPDLDQPQIEGVSATTALTSLMPHTYLNYLLSKTMQALEFQQLVQLAGIIPVRHVYSPDDLSRLPQIRDAILADFQTL